MSELVRYLEYKNDIKSVLLFVNNVNTIDLFADVILAFDHPEKMIIASKNHDTADDIIKTIRQKCENDHHDSIPDIEVQIYYDEISNRTGEVDAIVFDGKTEITEVLGARYLKPKYLIGQIIEDHTSYFKLWEQFKECARHIYIQAILSNRPEILNWDYDPDNDIELSVVFPVYNVAAYLTQCLETVTQWKAPYVEFLFVNDGSPDDSRNIIMEYAQKDLRIKLIDKENGGCASARDKGMQCAKGKYIGFVDPDDFVDPTMFKKLFKRAILGNYDVSYCGYNEYYETTRQSKKIPDTLGLPYSAGTIDETSIRNLIPYLRVAIWRGIYRLEFLRSNQIEFQTNLRRYDDLPFKNEVFAFAKSVVCVPEYLYYYRLNRPGQDVSCDDDRLYVHFDIFKHLDKRFSITGDQRLLDLLQISKVNTHCYALGKIQKKFIKVYCDKARLDLKQNNMSIRRTLYLLKKYCGGANSKAYLGIMFGKYSWIK